MDKRVITVDYDDSSSHPWVVKDYETEEILATFLSPEEANEHCLSLQKEFGMKWVQPAVDHPSHYGGEGNVYETIKIWTALGWLEPACLSNAMKYIMRAGKKGGKAKKLEDLKKAIFYLQYLVDEEEGKHPKPVHIPVEFVPLGDLDLIRKNAEEYREMGRDYPVSGAGNLIELIDEVTARIK